MFLTTALLAVSGCSRQQAGPEPDATTAAEPAPPAARQEVAALPRMPSAAGARAFFITPADGETVSSPVIIEFGIEGMQVVKAGDCSQLTVTSARGGTASPTVECRR